ncbi:bacteriohopanetetrol glucosamine biosynthesis glycosyltransferase HpnI [Burkholderia plantarii]|uniref:bacteriohopanetetrol glucosamine biosynthesis glycosyltransferase HpnI n=1 Tax=Burkholderia plantarii TaxID=41899 RepID=UPI00087083B8|nr:bacteriohopanetetrol glucosamine biosynthesis glycosyltransferase HpnI [Burkholderia plantarii]
MSALLPILDCMLLALTCAACAYAWFAALAPAPRAPDSRWRDGRAGVSVLKPLCGAEPRLYENLASFCRQRHPRYQIICGVASPADPAIAVVRRLQTDFPDCDLELVIDPRIHGRNRKVSNLINLDRRVRYGRLVIADSDIAVESDYLERVTAPLADPSIGVVTCLYHARGVGGFWTRIGAQFVDAWFAPSVRIAHLGGSSDFGFGATLALTRETLERIGGLAALKDELADDYWLAALPRRLGRRTVLSEVDVTTDVIETRFAELWARETRWLRTIRSLKMGGFTSLLITFTAPWLAMGTYLAMRLAGTVPGTIGAFAAAAGVLARLVLHARTASGWRAFWRDLPLVPIRDTLLFAAWIAAAFGSHVIWRGARIKVASAAPATATHAGAAGPTESKPGAVAPVRAATGPMAGAAASTSSARGRQASRDDDEHRLHEDESCKITEPF